MLKFSGIQPVQFGAKDCTPAALNAEIKLRLERISFDTEADTKKAEEILAGCFPDDEAYVLDFIRAKMTTIDKQILRAYLTGGDRAVDLLEETIKNSVAKQVEKKPEE